MFKIPIPFRIGMGLKSLILRFEGLRMGIEPTMISYVYISRLKPAQPDISIRE